MRMNKDTRWFFEFSKRVVCVITGLFVCHFVFVDIMVFITQDLEVLTSSTDNLTKVEIVCLGGYVFKAMLENVFKIKDHYGKNEDNIGGDYEEDIMG